MRVFFIYTRRTFKYVERELNKVPPHLPVLVLVSQDQIISVRRFSLLSKYCQILLALVEENTVKEGTLFFISFHRLKERVCPALLSALFECLGPVSRKFQVLFGPETPVVKLQSICFEKLIF